MSIEDAIRKLLKQDIHTYDEALQIAKWLQELKILRRENALLKQEHELVDEFLRA